MFYLGSKEKQLEKTNEADSRAGEQIVARPNFGVKLKDLPTSIKLLLQNPTFMCFMIGSGLDNFLLNGFVTFFPKFTEHQFNLAANEASFYSGNAS